MNRLLTILLLSLFASSASASHPPSSTREPKQYQLKHPVVLLHGASVKGPILQVGPLFLGDYWQRLPDYYRARGVEVATPGLPTNATIAEQAIVLKNYLQNKFPNRKVNLIGHSMGGLVARFLASVLDKDREMIASITGVATPNRGSPLSNWAWRQLEGEKFWYWVLRLFGYDLKYRKFLPELRPDYMEKKFNPRVPNVEGVKYYSVKAWGEPWTWTLSPLLYVPHYFNKMEDHPMAKEPNDGLVPLSSQTWGTVIATVQLDHLGQINHHTFRPSYEPEVFALYERILEQLAKDGL